MHAAEKVTAQRDGSGRAGEGETGKLHKIYDFRETKGPPEGGPFFVLLNYCRLRISCIWSRKPNAQAMLTIFSKLAYLLSEV